MPMLLLGVALAMPAAAHQPLRVTTDSPEYCGQLAERLASQPAAEEEPVRALVEEGLRLCDSGHIRIGIAKLRRALRSVHPSGQAGGG